MSAAAADLDGDSVNCDCHNVFAACSAGSALFAFLQIARVFAWRAHFVSVAQYHSQKPRQPPNTYTAALAIAGRYFIMMRRTIKQIAPRDVYYSVDAPKFCSNMVVWMSQRNCESVVDNGSGNVFKSVVQPGHQEDRVLITVLAWDKIKTKSIKSNVNSVGS